MLGMDSLFSLKYSPIDLIKIVSCHDQLVVYYRSMYRHINMIWDLESDFLTELCTVHRVLIVATIFYMAMVLNVCNHNNNYV